MTAGRVGTPFHVCRYNAQCAHDVITWVVLNMIILSNKIVAAITTQLLILLLAATIGSVVAHRYQCIVFKARSALLLFAVGGSA